MIGPVVIVPTGVANLASVQAGFERAGARSTLAESAAQVEDAARVMLPGVGAFGPAMDALEERGFADALRKRLSAARPTMAICLGLQLLFEESEESPGRKGLGILRGRARRFAEALTVPPISRTRSTRTGCRPGGRARAASTEAASWLRSNAARCSPASFTRSSQARTGSG